MDEIENKILPKFKWLLTAKQVPPPSPTLNPTPLPTDYINTNGHEETLKIRRGEYQPQGRDGYIQIEFTKKGKWTNARWEPLEAALHRHKLAGLNGRPKRLKA
ncbi:hypothetical protein I302_105334 [Kwoniella bestiolae CBS 10118]|uniref:Uncharacterized protein n=1 Tax=Kwoniella bestiolae CBS 10118 TaxID=1296100 RepID=A0A1B9FSU1_9TREE|nr:hypothetical protein I302_08620 [Kwoniella bestiolae CBS 10118]OCF21841.1 hypothetical protein I302_08620 [Kwoniella bestiolae CBS 10118]